MNISDFQLGKIYNRNDLIEAFKGAFQGGINICKRTNAIVITSIHTGNRIYDDKLFDGDVMYYTGEGQVGDQRMRKGNKAILNARENGFTIYLFVRFKRTEYTYYGKVSLVDEPFYADEKDINGNLRKVIKFPMMQVNQLRQLTEYEIKHIKTGTGDVSPMEKPVLQVVGAAILNNKGELLCAQRGSGSLIGKWEFPGGKVEKGETDQQAIVREIKEELDIEVEALELLDENFNEYKDKKVNLKVYKCKYISGEINDTEHQALKWAKQEDIEKLDWADADKPIVETYLDTLPRRIDGQINYDYFEAEALKTSRLKFSIVSL